MQDDGGEASIPLQTSQAEPQGGCQPENDYDVIVEARETAAASAAETPLNIAGPSNKGVLSIDNPNYDIFV